MRYITIEKTRQGYRVKYDGESVHYVGYGLSAAKRKARADFGLKYKRLAWIEL